MGAIPQELREIIAWNIRACRLRKFPGRGGGKQCAEAFGVSPQQWSPWERGMRTPDEIRLAQMAEFFGVTVEWMRRDHRPQPAEQPQETPPKTDSPPPGGIAGVDYPPPPAWEPALVMSIETHGLRLDKQSLEYLAHSIRHL